MTIEEPVPVSNSFRKNRQASPAKLVSNFQNGDSNAASQLHQLFARRLLALVRQRMNPAFNRRLDPEDIVQSAFRSFFRVVSADSWTPDGRSEQVWSLLCAITVNKLNARVRFHSAAKRSVEREVFAIESLSQRDMQEAEAIFVDELECVMRENTERQQQILKLLLGGRSEAEVAELKQCSLRTVYRVLERVVDQLQTRLND